MIRWCLHSLPSTRLVECSSLGSLFWESSEYFFISLHLRNSRPVPYDQNYYQLDDCKVVINQSLGLSQALLYWTGLHDMLICTSKVRGTRFTPI